MAAEGAGNVCMRPDCTDVQSNVWGTFFCDPTVKISDGSHYDLIIFGNTKSIANQKKETSSGYHSDHKLALGSSRVFSKRKSPDEFHQKFEGNYRILPTSDVHKYSMNRISLAND